jgi:signal transduction histidine kinase
MWNRSKVLIDSRLQFKVVSLLGLVAFLAALALVATVYMHHLKVAAYIEQAQMSPKALASDFRELTEILMTRLLVIVVLMVGTFMFLGLVLTHRIAGPMYRLRTELSKMLQGKEISKIQFRKDDEFQDLSQLINQLVERCKNTGR